MPESSSASMNSRWHTAQETASACLPVVTTLRGAVERRDSVCPSRGDARPDRMRVHASRERRG
eukprot:2614499-Prymnesium_polylepis.1